MRISVLYVIDTLEVGGAEKSLLEIVERLNDVDVTVCHIYSGDALRAEYEKRRVRVISLNIRGKYAPVRTVAALRKLIGDLDPDIVHSMLFRANLFCRVATVRSRTALVESLVNDSYGERRSRAMQGKALWKHRFLRRVDRATAGRVQFFVANSAAIGTSNATALGIPASRLRVIHRGRNPSDYRVGDAAGMRVRAELKVVGCPLVLNIARLRERKGQADLLRAVQRLTASFPDLTLLVAGEGPFRGTLESMIGRLGLRQSVLLLGHREDVPSLLSAADVFVFPSHFEGHPGSLLEAMFSGKPIVASDTPEHRETVEHGKTALLVPVGDAEAMASAIDWMLKHSDEAREMGVRARRVARERFNINEAARRHEEIYRELMASRGESR
jgi:glycosyltransferase involved in cell wall biosynthesis